MTMRWLAAALLVSSWSAAARAAPPDTVESYLQRRMQQLGIPGLQYAVVRHGKIVDSGALGISNLEESVPVTATTLFPIHSITKAFTGVAILQLVEAGKLELDAPISRYLDGLPAAWRAVTIHQLLSHISGLPDIWTEDSTLIANTEEAAWAKVQTLPLEFKAGERFKYNQTNYVLLGKLIEKLSGEPFEQYIRDNQLNRVGMPLATFGDSRDIVPHLAGSYAHYRFVDGKPRTTAKLEKSWFEFPPSLRTAAGLETTATELASWVIALQSGKLLDKSSLAALWTPARLNDGQPRAFSPLINGYAVGWPMSLRPKHRAAAATGGGKAALYVYLDDDLSVIILTNLMGAGPEATMIDEVAAYYIPEMHAVTGFGFGPGIGALSEALVKNGFTHAVETADALRAKDPGFTLDDNQLVNWGYAFVERGRFREAIEVFKVDAHLYPQSWNAYDSLAEAYEDAGEKQLAIANYRRSLELEPKNQNAADHLAKLGAAAK